MDTVRAKHVTYWYNFVTRRRGGGGGGGWWRRRRRQWWWCGYHCIT